MQKEEPKHEHQSRACQEIQSNKGPEAHNKQDVETEIEQWTHSRVYLGHGEWGDIEKGIMAPTQQLEVMNTWERLQLQTDRLPQMDSPGKTFKNHKGASDHPQALRRYIEKEKGKGAILGPFNKIPFNSNVDICPLSTRPKKDSTERRVIVDLSFPQGNAVNDGMIKNNYLGFVAELRFPRTDDLAMRIAHLGKNAVMFKIDLSRYFRQIPLDPGDYSLIGYIIEGELCFDKVMPMGMRTAPYIAQRITNAIRHIHESKGYFLLNYIDDFLRAEARRKIYKAFEHLTKLQEDLRVETAPEKIIPPTRIEFLVLGVTLDSETMTMEVSQDRIRNMLVELNAWNSKDTATRKEVESLIGKLQFASKCVKPGRTFIARLIPWLRKMHKRNRHSIPHEARKYIAWWDRFLEQYKGVSILWLTKYPTPDTAIAIDACPTGFGGIFGKQYFHGQFPQELRQHNIAHLEILAVLVVLRIWKSELKGKYFWVHVDNGAVATVLNTGASRDENLQQALREILMVAAVQEFIIKAKHIRGVDNRIPDWLSKWHDLEARQKFQQYAKDKQFKEIKPKIDILHMTDHW